MSEQKKIESTDLLPIQENGKTYWRSLEHIAQTEEFQEFVHREFPAGASELTDPVTRRSFLGLMGASFALAGLGTGCVRRPEEKIVPYGKRPEDLVPGLPQFYATTMVLGDEVVGLVVEAHEGRPTKVEGNPLHPGSLGGTSAIHQGAILSLYDPDRTVRVLHEGKESDFPSLDAAFNERLEALARQRGRGLLIVHEPSRSPSFHALLERVRRQYPEATIVSWDPVAHNGTTEGARIAFGKAVEPVYSVAQADTIVAVEADLLGSGPHSLRYSREWASRREPDSPEGMNRLWAFEAVFTPTGAAADHRFRIGAGEAGAFLRHLAAALEQRGLQLPAGIAQRGDFDAKVTDALAKELLERRRGRTLIVVGRHEPAEVQAIAFALNHALGNTDRTVRYSPAFQPVEGRPDAGIRLAAEKLTKGEVDTVILLGGNPAYDAPSDLNFGEALGKAKHRFHLTWAPNETSALCEWVIPETHFLEEWGDAVAIDGTFSLVQPLIRPIWYGRSKLEVLSHIAGRPRKGYDIVRENFLATRGGEELWQRVLHDGVLEGSARFVEVELDEAAVAQAASKVARPDRESLKVVFRVDSKVYDGRFANNGWLQEMPEPLTKLTWTNGALVSPATAKRLGLQNTQRVRVEVGGRSLELGVWIQPGQADDTVAIALGYGRTHAGRVGNGRGANAYALRTGDALWLASGARLTALSGKELMPTTQSHGFMEGRPIVREASLTEYKADPEFAKKMVEHPPLIPLWPEHEWIGQQWGMAIDLNRCIGCNGCVVACQAENNIPIVGPEQVRMGRAMHWLRIDRYYASTNPADPTDLSEPEVVHQPVSCQQCEHAPCENVCPVAATVHSLEGGLNDMVYNRCVGTRYCANNCPYKVRRFNFLDFHQKAGLPKVRQLAFNPDVTVRTRGVMEKCTYCVQRINAARRDAKVAGLDRVPDGVITPACAQACPTEAIVFGDITDPASRVSKRKKEARNYELLGELNTQPRTSYLARVRNPNPELVS